MSKLQERRLHVDRRSGGKGGSDQDSEVAMPGLFGEIRRTPRPHERQAMPKLRESPGIPTADAGVTSHCCDTCPNYADKPAGSSWRWCRVMQTPVYYLYENCRLREERKK